MSKAVGTRVVEGSNLAKKSKMQCYVKYLRNTAQRYLMLNFSDFAMYFANKMEYRRTG